MKITDEAVEALSESLIGAAWATFDEGLLNTLRAIHRSALEAALPHLEGATPTSGFRAAIEADMARIEDGIAKSTWADREGFLVFHRIRELLERYPEGATPAIDRDAIVAALAGKPIIRSGDKPEGWRGSLAEEECGDVADLLLALIGGAS